MANIISFLGFSLLVIRFVYWVYAVWETGTPSRQVFLGQLVEFFLLFLFLTQLLRTTILPMPPSSLSSFIGFVFVCCGVGGAFVGKMQLGKSWQYAGSKKVAKKLVTTGIYRYVRHPIYVSIIFSFVGMELLLGSYLWITFCALGIPLYAQIKKEEKELEKKFGTRYRNYRKSSRYFIPFIW